MHSTNFLSYLLTYLLTASIYSVLVSPYDFLTLFEKLPGWSA